jgi:hypothetical protein
MTTSTPPQPYTEDRLKNSTTSVDANHATRPMRLSYPVWFRLGRVRYMSLEEHREVIIITF